MTRNIVLLCLDSVRADTFQEYAPRIQSRQTTEFTQCRAASSWSVPSHASMLTGTLPHCHGVHTGNCDYTTLQYEDTFLSELSNYRTVGISANTWVGSSFGFDNIFDEFKDISATRYFSDGMDFRTFDAETNHRYIEFINSALGHDRPLLSLANGIITKLNSLATGRRIPRFMDYGGQRIANLLKNTASETEPFFAFANFMESHTPHQHLRSYDESKHDVGRQWHSGRLDSKAINVEQLLDHNQQDIQAFRELYNSSVNYLDRLIDDLLDEIHSRTNLETTVIITADHGENLCYDDEDNLFGHKSSLSEGVLHVPFIIDNPPKPSEKIYTDKFISHLDLGKYIVSLASGKFLDFSSDTVAAELMGMGFDTWNLTDEEYSWWDRTQRCAYKDNKKILWDCLNNIQEYQISIDKKSSQKKITDTADIPGWAAEHFSTNIQDYKHGSVKTGKQEMDSGTKDRLSDLGYL